MNHFLHKCTMTRKDMNIDSFIFPEDEFFDEEDDELIEELQKIKESLYEITR